MAGEPPSDDEVGKEEAEEVDRTLPEVWHASHFLWNLINSRARLHRGSFPFITACIRQTRRTLTSEETSEESDYRALHLAGARLRPPHNYKQARVNTALIVIRHFGLTNNLN